MIKTMSAIGSAYSKQEKIMNEIYDRADDCSKDTHVDQKNQNPVAVVFEEIQRRLHAGGQKRFEHFASIKRRKRQEIEDRQRDVHDEQIVEKQYHRLLCRIRHREYPPAHQQRLKNDECDERDQ